ncbi:unnamed protein product [Lampetra planeri]
MSATQPPSSSSTAAVVVVTTGFGLHPQWLRGGAVTTAMTKGDGGGGGGGEGKGTQLRLVGAGKRDRPELGQLRSRAARPPLLPSPLPLTPIITIIISTSHSTSSSFHRLFSTAHHPGSALDDAVMARLANA